MENTQRLGLAMLAVGQAQKELTHNLSLQVLDTVVAAAVEELPLNDPPSDAAIGQCWIVGDAPTGAWSGQAQSLAAFTTAGWQFVPPAVGMTAFVGSTGTVAAYRAGAWELGQVRADALLIGGQQVVGGREAAIAAPAGGTVVDSEARAALSAILAALRQHGLIET